MSVYPVASMFDGWRTWGRPTVVMYAQDEGHKSGQDDDTTLST